MLKLKVKPAYRWVYPTFKGGWSAAAHCAPLPPLLPGLVTTHSIFYYHLVSTPALSDDCSDLLTVSTALHHRHLMMSPVSLTSLCAHPVILPRPRPSSAQIMKQPCLSSLITPLLRAMR
jgi:hypothetical protein